MRCSFSSPLDFSKICAWFPTSFVSDFCDILPTFLSTSTALEVLHCILDLPCMTAALLCEAEETRVSHIWQYPTVASTMKSLLRNRSGSEQPEGYTFNIFVPLQYYVELMENVFLDLTFCTSASVIFLNIQEFWYLQDQLCLCWSEFNDELHLYFL